MGEWLLSGRRGGRVTSGSQADEPSAASRPGAVHLNQASVRQVVALLRLTPGEAWEVLRARPLRSAEELRILLPEGVLQGPVSLVLERLPLNDAREVELIHLAGLSPAQASKVCAGRPYTSEQALQALPSLNRKDLGRLLEIFKVSGGPRSEEATHPLEGSVPQGSSGALRRRGG